MLLIYVFILFYYVFILFYFLSSATVSAVLQARRTCHMLYFVIHARCVVCK